MTQVSFYHLLHWPLERALPKLLEKALERGMRALVVAGSTERVDQLNPMLWTYDAASFLPHGTGTDGAEAQPILLVDNDDNANGASLLVLLDSTDSERIADFERVIDMFDGHDDEAVSAARQRWKAHKDSGHALTYWQQTERGGWEKKAEANTGDAA